MSQQYLSQKTLHQNFLQKLTFFEYFYVLVLIFYAGYANTFVRTASSIKANFTGYFIPIILSIILAVKWRVLPDKRFYFLVLGLGIYFLAISIKYSQIRITIFLDYLTLFIVIYACVKALKFNFFKIYEYWLYYLAIIGTILWIIQFALGGNTLINQLSTIPGINSFSFVSGNGINAIIYSVQPFDYNLRNNLGSSIPRNSGFAWEPGAFAVYICLAIFINLFISDTDKNSKIRLWILLAALFTTQSTTGFSMLLVILLFYYYNKNVKIILIVFPIAITVLFLIFSLPFMTDKIVALSNNSNDVDMMVIRSINSEEQVHPQRFASFVIAYRDFKNNPILGTIGGGPEETWTYKLGANIAMISGIGLLMAQTGLVGLLFFILLSLKTSFSFPKYFRYKGKFLLFFLILFISISYGIKQPVIACFWMFSFFEYNKAINKKLRIEFPNQNNDIL